MIPHKKGKSMSKKFRLKVDLDADVGAWTEDAYCVDTAKEAAEVLRFIADRLEKEGFYEEFEPFKDYGHPMHEACCFTRVKK